VDCGLWFVVCGLGVPAVSLGVPRRVLGFPGVWVCPAVSLGVPRIYIYIYIYGPYPFLLKEACQPAGFLNSLQHLRFCTEFVFSSALVHEGLVDTDGSQ
jgi:hypothetical protein